MFEEFQVENLLSVEPQVIFKFLSFKYPICLLLYHPMLYEGTLGCLAVINCLYLSQEIVFVLEEGDHPFKELMV